MKPKARRQEKTERMQCAERRRAFFPSGSSCFAVSERSLYLVLTFVSASKHCFTEESKVPNISKHLQADLLTPFLGKTMNMNENEHTGHQKE